MNYKQGISREQLSIMSFENFIASDNPVRVIEAFVEQLDLVGLGFTKTTLSKEGRPPFEAKVLLKLYYYGYLNRIRSSRKLQAECRRNVELWWLINGLTPTYHTIADFRKDNAEALKKSFKMFAAFLRGEDLFEGKIIAADGTKIRAQNNKKNNFNEQKFEKSLAYIDSKAEEYIKALEESDAQEQKDKETEELKRKEVTKKLQELKERKEHYKELQDTMVKSGEKQISMSDPESRSLPLKDGITDVCYNVQAVADSKHSLIVAFETVNTTDQGQLCQTATEARKAIEVEEITVLADKGYHTGKDLSECKENHITTIVAYPERNSRDIAPAYQTDKFIYNKEQDCYTCPQGALLTTNGKEYKKTKKGQADYLVKKYQTKACCACPLKDLCTKSPVRIIERSQYQDVIDENNKRVDQNPALYKKRQQIIEHVFGTIKRSWGYTYTLVKGLKKVNGEMSIIFTVYNLRRVMSILGVNELISRLKRWKAAYQDQQKAIFRSFYLYRLIKFAIAA